MRVPITEVIDRYLPEFIANQVYVAFGKLAILSFVTGAVIGVVATYFVMR